MKRIPGDEVQNRLAAIMNRDGAEYDFSFVRIGPGKYWFGRKRVIVKLARDQIVVLLGGGYVTLKKFLRLFGTSSEAGQEALAAFHGAGARCRGCVVPCARHALTVSPCRAAVARGDSKDAGFGVGDQNYKKKTEGGIVAQGHTSVRQDVVDGQVVGEVSARAPWAVLASAQDGFPDWRAPSHRPRIQWHASTGATRRAVKGNTTDLRTH